MMNQCRTPRPRATTIVTCLLTRTCVFDPNTFIVTVYVPAWRYVFVTWAMFGFVSCVPSPKSHAIFVIVVVGGSSDGVKITRFVDRLSGTAVKSAVNGGLAAIPLTCTIVCGVNDDE